MSYYIIIEVKEKQKKAYGNYSVVLLLRPKFVCLTGILQMPLIISELINFQRICAFKCIGGNHIMTVNKNVSGFLYHFYYN